MSLCPCQTKARPDRTGRPALPCAVCGHAVQLRTLVTHADHRHPVCIPCARKADR